MTPPHAAATPPVQHEWVAGPGDIRRIALAATVAAARRPAFAVLAAVCVGFFVVRAVLVRLDAFLAVGVLMPLVLLGVTYLVTYRALRTTMAPGARWESGFGEEALLIGSPVGRSVLPYRSLTAIRPAGAVVFLSVAPRGRLGYPATLFPPAAVEFVRGRIGR